MVRLHIIVSGSVQAVGFRYYAYTNAFMLGLTGWVRNCDDGTVEIEVQGADESLAEYLRIVKKGSRYSEVEHLEVDYIEAVEHESSFKIEE